MTAKPRKSPGAPDRLAARAFALAIDPAVSPEAAGATLLVLARGSTADLARARSRVEARLIDRPTRLAEAAALALRAALAAARASVDESAAVPVASRRAR